MPELVKLCESTKNVITKDKSNENVPHFELNEVGLVHCNHNEYQLDSRVLYTVISSKLFGQLPDISPKNF